MKIAVISDIHCHNHLPNKQKGGYYYPLMPDDPVKQNPFSALKKYIKDNRITTDIVMSPGDYSHEIDPQGLKSSWDQLKLLTTDFKADFLIGTIGNHDVESRGTEKKDVFDLLKKFDTDFPVYKLSGPEHFKKDLLTDGYFILEANEILFIVFNTSYDHWDTAAARHGRVEIDKLDKIKTIIDQSQMLYKIVLIHHHPIVHETGLGDTGDVIQGSEEFLKCIDNVDFIVHGHKHDFRFTQKRLFPKNLNILGSGSFSCFMTAMKPLTLNSFHIINFIDGEVEACINHGLVKTYTYNPYEGWKYEKGFIEGFGNISELSEIVFDIKAIIETRELPYISWDEITSSCEKLKYISRSTRNQALDILKERGDIATVTYDSYSKYPVNIIIR